MIEKLKYLVAEADYDEYENMLHDIDHLPVTIEESDIVLGCICELYDVPINCCLEEAYKYLMVGGYIDEDE